MIVTNNIRKKKFFVLFLIIKLNKTLFIREFKKILMHNVNKNFKGLKIAFLISLISLKLKKKYSKIETKIKQQQQLINSDLSFKKKRRKTQIV